MLNGRQKIEAALSGAGPAELAVVIPYEGIFIRDHWDALTDCPWWYAHSPDVDHQIAWRRDAIRAVGQDWFQLPIGASADECAHVTVRADGEDAVRTDRRTGERTPIRRPRVGGWSPAGGLHSATRTAAGGGSVSSISSGLHICSVTRRCWPMKKARCSSNLSPSCHRRKQIHLN